MKETLTNYKLKNSRMVKAMKYLHSFLMPLAFLSIVGRTTFMVEYPIISNLLFIYMIAFVFIQIPYAVYFRFKYNKESIEREAEFKEANNL